MLTACGVTALAAPSPIYSTAIGNIVIAAAITNGTAAGTVVGKSESFRGIQHCLDLAGKSKRVVEVLEKMSSQISC
jgi:hypothetical protein